MNTPQNISTIFLQTLKKLLSYLVRVQLAVHLKGLMVVQETHWGLWAAVCLQYYHNVNDTYTYIYEVKVSK